MVRKPLEVVTQVDARFSTMAGAEAAGTANAALAATSKNTDTDFNEELSMVAGLGIFWRRVL